VVFLALGLVGAALKVVLFLAAVVVATFAVHPAEVALFVALVLTGVFFAVDVSKVAAFLLCFA
jgi:hypothetical protein